eukprot:TRINITY_DN102721_c0_g1_i2.p2 TRINITY_DN102721_c0_g1~~TRINITY_DN102721_c0_g1_i2.p2  ORF type:complete len:227 (+),score=22.56 TRINITY_DN102721_c0_g1_i2:93-773(+)
MLYMKLQTTCIALSLLVGSAVRIGEEENAKTTVNASIITVGICDPTCAGAPKDVRCALEECQGCKTCMCAGSCSEMPLPHDVKCALEECVGCQGCPDGDESASGGSSGGSSGGPSGGAPTDCDDTCEGMPADVKCALEECRGCTDCGGKGGGGGGAPDPDDCDKPAPKVGSGVCASLYREKQVGLKCGKHALQAVTRALPVSLNLINPRETWVCHRTDRTTTLRYS